MASIMRWVGMPLRVIMAVIVTPMALMLERDPVDFVKFTWKEFVWRK